jgi:hypothetical protein
MRIVITTILPRRGPRVARRRIRAYLVALFSTNDPTTTLGSVPPLDRIDDPVKLRRLVQAMLMMEGELSLPIVLRHLVGEACAWSMPGTGRSAC